MKITKELIEKLKEYNAMIKTAYIKKINFDKLINKDTDNLSSEDIKNALEIDRKKTVCWFNEDTYSCKINDNDDIQTINMLNMLFNTAKIEMNHDELQDLFLKKINKDNENNFISRDDENSIYYEKKSSTDENLLNDFPSFYIDENGKTQVYKHIINLYEILGWEENAVYYVPDKLAFYKIKDNSLYQKDIQITGDYFNLINEKYSQELFEILENSIKDEDCNHLKNLSDYIKSVKNIEPKTIEEVWNKLIEIEKRDNNFCWNYHNNLEQRIKKEKNLINYIQAIYLCAYGELQDNTLVIKFKDIQKPLKYNIEKNEITLMRYFVNNNIKEVKNYAELIGCTEHEFKDLISAVKQLNPEDIPKNYIPCEKLKKIVNHFYDLYKDAISYFSVGYNIDNDYDEISPLVDFIKKHKKEVSKELLEDAILYDEDNLKWCKKHELRYEY